MPTPAAYFRVILLALCFSTQVSPQNVSELTTTANHTSAGTGANATTVPTNIYSGGGANQTTPSGGGNSLQSFNPTCLLPVLVAASFLRC